MQHKSFEEHQPILSSTMAGDPQHLNISMLPLNNHIAIATIYLQDIRIHQIYRDSIN